MRNGKHCASWKKCVAAQCTCKEGMTGNLSHLLSSSILTVIWNLSSRWRPFIWIIGCTLLLGVLKNISLIPLEELGMVLEQYWTIRSIILIIKSLNVMEEELSKVCNNSPQNPIKWLFQDFSSYFCSFKSGKHCLGALFLIFVSAISQIERLGRK